MNKLCFYIIKYIQMKIILECFIDKFKYFYLDKKEI